MRHDVTHRDFLDALLRVALTPAQVTIVAALERHGPMRGREELAVRCKTTPSGAFRDALRELVDRGVVIRDWRPGTRGAYRLEQDATQWDGAQHITHIRMKHGTVIPVTPPPEPVKKDDHPPESVSMKTMKQKGRPTWLTPYFDAWKAAYGTDLVAHAGRTARDLDPVHKELGGEECVRRWRAYLGETEVRFASTSRFALAHTQYAPDAVRRTGAPAERSFVDVVRQMEAEGQL